MMQRRRFLKGLAGAVVALPALESVRFLTRNSSRAFGVGNDSLPIYSFFMAQSNGCQQAFGGEPERFWPSNLGPITTQSLMAEDRALSVLAPHADKLLLVRGTDYVGQFTGCGHTFGFNKMFTAAPAVVVGDYNYQSLANGPSIDWFLYEKLGAPMEPLALMSGPQAPYLGHAISYSAALQLRGAYNNPFSAYQTLMGLSGAPDEVLQALAARRMSVNDLVRGEMNDLLALPNLSEADRARLNGHFESIRDLEIRIGCMLTGEQVAAMEAISAVAEQNDNRVRVAEMMVDIAVLGFACGAIRSATLQVGSVVDQTRYTINGQLANAYHRISHRVDSDGNDGAAILNADLLHHEIDKIHANIFKRYLDQMAAITGPSGAPLLNDSVAMWSNGLSNGPPHGLSNIPQVIAGNARGFLKTGQYIDAGGTPHNQLLNTIINAVGVRNADGSYYDQFGDSSAPRGVIAKMIA